MTALPRQARGVRDSKWFPLVWIAPTAVVVVLLAIVAARLFRDSATGAAFVADYPGLSPMPGWAPTGIPGWLAWQHGINAFLMVFIVKSGWLVRTTQRPPMYWTRRSTGPIRATGNPTKMSIHLWLHVATDTLWVVNGAVFYVLLFTSGQWARIVPTSWDVFPNAASAAVQYASLDWPTENGWVGYNGLQLLTYFVIVFLVTPLSILTGVRMSPSWPKRAERINQLFPIELARRLHFPLMIAFVAFVVVHVALVFATGALRNLNHMYAAHDGLGWTGFWVFVSTVIVTAAAWIALRPMTLRAVASTMGDVTRS